MAIGQAAAIATTIAALPLGILHIITFSLRAMFKGITLIFAVVVRRVASYQT